MEEKHELIKKNENGSDKTLSDHPAFIAKNINSQFKMIQCSGLISEDTNSENKPTKPLAFKWQKSSTEIKTKLQNSTAKAFTSFDQDDDMKLSKNKLSFLEDEVNSGKSTITNAKLATICLYEEPTWGGIPKGTYKMDVLKSGVITTTLNLSYKSYHVIGTSLSCDISLSHETISEYHAVLQYRNVKDPENEIGVYIYDMNSTHGTFVNGIKIKSHIYIIVHDGDLVSFGESQRKYVLRTPKDMEEQEAQLSATELQELHEIELQEQQKIIEEESLKQSELLKMKEEDSKGISWGIVDVDEYSRSSISSEYSESDDEVSYMDDPKKALQDWFRWEGYDLEYQTEDKGFGRFSCCIDLTLDPLGSTKRINVTVNGDKMKAIDACILKACKFLDGYGFLQQASKEKKSTTRDWEAADYYDSDEDNFLDRTGVIERKRRKRMEMDGKLKTLKMRDSLSEKYTEVCDRITNLEGLINSQKQDETKIENLEDDALDIYMNELSTSSLSKARTKEIKLELQNLHKEKILLLDSMNVKIQAAEISQSKSAMDSITEKTKNGCRFSN